jgi:uncharacterized protein (TIGR00251 family)
MKPELQYLDVKVSPKASRDAVLGWYGDALKIAVTAAPERGRANAAVAALLAESLRIPASRIEVVAGRTTARKRLSIEGLTRAELYARLPQR